MISKTKFFKSRKEDIGLIGFLITIDLTASRLVPKIVVAEFALFADLTADSTNAHKSAVGTPFEVGKIATECPNPEALNGHMAF
jgi:hypothetical protein